MEFTQEEKLFLSNFLIKLTVNVMADDAVKSVEIIQSIVKKLNA